MNPLLTNESKCEFTFAKATPMWHVYTPGNITEIIFTCQEDYAFAINALCITALRYPMTSIVAFEILSNHIHLVISGDKNIVADFFNRFRNKLSRGLPGRLPDSFRMCIKPINDLKSVRNHIVYVHRNAYVANPNVLPYSYPWSSGGYYFQPRAGEKTLDEFSYDEIRAMVKGRFPADLPKDLRITNGHFSPASFCSIKFGQSLFRDAHQYFALLSKNVEAYSELALEIGDDTFLTDEEMFSAALRKCRADYGAISLRGLQRVQIIELARYLHYDLHASNGQLRRILGLTQAEADSLFPLSAKNVN